MVERRPSRDRRQSQTQATPSIMDRLFPGGPIFPTKEQVEKTIKDTKRKIAEEARKGPRPEDPGIDGETLRFMHDF